MRKTFVLFLFATISITSIAQESVNDFDWLIGSWQKMEEKPGKTTTESWRIEGNELVGMGVTLFGTDTVFVEKLSIKKIDGDFYYIADLKQNQKPGIIQKT